MSARPRTTARVATLALLAGCVPEAANVVEIRQTVVEILDLGRAMAIEHALVDLSTTVDGAGEPAEVAAAIVASAALAVPCATVTAVGERGVRIDFGAASAGCEYAGRGFAGFVRVDYSLPSPGAPLAVLSHGDVVSDGALLTGTTQVTWGRDGTRRLVSELRLDSPEPRQIEIQSDRIVRTYQGALQIDGWLRWQTLLGKWKMELSGWEQDTGARVPARGLAQIATPYDHDVIVDFTGPIAEGQGLRANGGRRDHVFAIADDGEIIDLGDD